MHSSSAALGELNDTQIPGADSFDPETCERCYIAKVSGVPVCCLKFAYILVGRGVVCIRKVRGMGVDDA